MGIYVSNYTVFFTREAMLHSIGDIKLSWPVSLKKVFFGFVVFLVWAVPIFYFFGFAFSFWRILFTIGPVFLITHFGTQPIWGGQTLVAFALTAFRFLSRPRKSTLTQGVDLPRKISVDHTTWVSRRRELLALSLLKEERELAE